MPALLLLIVLFVDPDSVFWVLLAELVVFFAFGRQGSESSDSDSPVSKPTASKPTASKPLASESPQSPELSDSDKTQLNKSLAGLDIERLHRLEQMAAVGQMSASLAHEVNNPLAFIRSNLEELKNDIDDLIQFSKDVDAIADRLEPEHPVYQALEEAWAKHFITNIQHETPERVSDSLYGIHRISQVTQGMKSLINGVSAPKKVSTSLNDELKKILRIVKPRLKAGMQMDVDLLDESPELFCSPCQIGQVLLNLVINAMQVMGEKGGSIQLREFMHENELEIQVQDDGPGMTDEVRAQAFEPFFTTRQHLDGTGIGLFLSRQIVEDHGGRIELETAQGQGCCFRIFLPLKQENSHVQ
ncbi:MAG: sensor histidine kinase [Oceanobacter sp.]